MSKNPVVHFEMPAQDGKRVSEFYSKAFGWQMNQMGEEMGGYIVAQTAETDENNMVTTPGAINGGFWKTDQKDYPHVVISVDSIEDAMKAVEEAGGKVIGASGGPGTIDDIPGVGRYTSIEDTEGNRVALLQPNPR